MTEKTIHIDESDRGSCYYCGSPAAIKVGMWSDLEPRNEEDEKQSWRVCSDLQGM